MPNDKPIIIPRTPETEKAAEVSVPSLLWDLAKKVGGEIKDYATKKVDIDELEPIEELGPELEQEILDKITGSFTPTSGIIKASKGVRPLIRRAMRFEKGARAKKPPALMRQAGKEGEWKKFENAQDKFLKENKWFSDLVRGTWFHGRQTMPKPGEKFTGVRQKVGNPGEPRGLSLTGNIDWLPGSSFSHPSKEGLAKIADLKAKRTRLDTEFVALANKYAEQVAPGKQARVKQLLSDVSIGPSAKSNLLVMMEEGPKTAAGKSIKERLINIVKQKAQLEDALFTSEGESVAARVLPLFKANPEKQVLPAWKSSETKWAQDILKDTYKEAAVNVLSKLKQNNPPRFQERVARQGVRGILSGTSTRQWFNDEISSLLQRKGFKGLLYSPERYGEYEMRMLNPADAMLVDVRNVRDPSVEALFRPVSRPKYRLPTTSSGKPIRNILGAQGKTRQMKLWRERLSELPASLRDIYADIDLQKSVLGKLHD